MHLSINTRNIPSLLNYTFIVYCIVWESIRIFLMSIDGYGRLGMILLFIALIVNFTHLDVWRKFRIPAIAIWLTWVIVEWLRWYEAGLLWEGNPDKWYFTYYNFIRCIAAMIIATVEMNRNPRRFLRIALWAFVVYVTMGILFQLKIGTSARSSHDTLEGLGNMLPLTSLGMVAMGMISFYLAGLSKKTVWILFGLSILTIMACATRKAFGGLAILFIIWYFNTESLWKAKNFIIMVIGGIVLFAALNYVMESTTIGDRFSDIDNQSKEYQYNLFLKLMADRAVQYVLGWEIFLQYPLWGVGLLNFQHYSGYFVQLHTEYMVQLCECGVIGFVMFILFILSIFNQIHGIMHRYKHIALIFIAWMCCVLFLSLTAWTFNIPFYYIIYGIIIGSCQLLKNNCKRKVLSI